MERGVVRTENTAIEVCALLVLFLDGTDMRVLYNFYGQHIRTFLHAVRHIESAADESTFQTTYLLSVQIDIGFPVDAVEVQKYTVALERGRYLELIAVPEVRVEERSA